jgi:hypothetical protein
MIFPETKKGAVWLLFLGDNAVFLADFLGGASLDCSGSLKKSAGDESYENCCDTKTHGHD